MEKSELSLPGVDHRHGFGHILTALQQDKDVRINAIGHRVVHGGELFSAPVVIDQGVIEAIRSLVPLAPLHNPANLLGIEVARESCADVDQVAVFDTAFHQTMPDFAGRYPLPKKVYEKHHVRRYGFHGTSHSYVSKAAADYMGMNYDTFNCIVLHLGNGASACAIQGGRSVDTSMGLTPLEGLVMGTRCGDIDPAIIFYLERNGGMDVNQIDDLLNRESGLKGLCGTNDMRRLLEQREEGSPDAALAFDLYCYRLKKYIGAYLAALGRIDALIFTGGIGENAALVREQSCQGLAGLGIAVDANRNRQGLADIMEIQVEGTDTRVLVVPTDEEKEIAIQTHSLLTAHLS
jgi:acetate kinase